MKTKSFYLSCLCLLSVIASASVSTEYQDVMTSALAKLDVSASQSNYLQCKNQFERIAQKYSSEWLPVYYTAYCDIQATFIPGDGDVKPQQLLDEAKIILEKLDKFPNADASEVNTLWGYYYTALIALDPATNGQSLFMNPISRFEKAIEQNVDNPRPVCLLAFFRQQMPAFLRTDKEIADGKEKAAALFAKEKPAWDKPYWGAYFLQMIQTK